ncbi:hypothetical protein [Vulcanococcus limneticus]|uniref:hypothetical protein n=1 Tax=Vulcanococcus limneticus TaxID=2170428 RepID=UPI00398C1721
MLPALPDDLAPFLSQVAAVADLCLKPWRHAAVIAADPFSLDSGDLILLLEARDQQGCRHPDCDLELEVFRSGSSVHLMVSRCNDAAAPVLWQGGHPLWMAADSGQRCERPDWGVPLEALARRLRALITDG